MSYISAIKNNNDVVVWERTEFGRTMTNHKAPYYYYKKDPNGQYTSMFGDTLERFDYDTYSEFNKARSQEFSKGNELFESDIPPELKYLSQHYYNVPAPKLHVTYFDIEVDYDKKRGFSSVADPYAPINSVAIYHNWSNRMVIIAVPPPNYSGPTDVDSILEAMDKNSPLPTDCKIEVTICKNEKELLMVMLDEFDDSDIISGWNCIPVNQNIWGKHAILPINDATQLLYDSTIVTKFPSSMKELWNITLANGATIGASADHIFPVLTHKSNGYTNLQNNTIIKTEQTILYTFNIKIQKPLD